MKTIYFIMFLCLVTFNVWAQEYISDTIPEDTEKLLNTPLGPRYILPSVPTIVFNNQIPSNAIKDGTYKCLNTNEWKQILIITNEYKSLHQWRLQMQSVVSGLLFLMNKTDDLIDNYELQLEVYKQEQEYLRLRLSQSNKEFNQTNKMNLLEKYTLWGIIVAQTVSIVIISVKSLSEK